MQKSPNQSHLTVSVLAYHTVFPQLKMLNAGSFPRLFPQPGVNLECSMYHYASVMLHATPWRSI